ncbi:MAG: beta-ketoacyl synthase N-terminal-like domain-containing protein, partial [Acidimicrobiia bacterium]
MSETNAYLDHRGRPRVVITGIGVKTPAGNDIETFWSRIQAGKSTAAPFEFFDGSDLSVTFGCEVREFDPVAYFGPKESRRVDRFTQLGFAAAVDALADAGDPGADPARCAVVTGTGVGGIWTY